MTFVQAARDTDEHGRLREADAADARALLADHDRHDTLRAALPRDLFGPWELLPPYVASTFRSIVEEDVRATMDAFPGPLRARTAGALNWLAESKSLPGTLRRSAGRWSARVWRLPGRLRAAATDRARARRFARDPRPHLRDLVAALGRRPDWLTWGFAEGVHVDPRCRGFWHDPRRNVVYGYVLGIDVVLTPDGAVVHEANLNAGLGDPVRRGYWGDVGDPLPSALADLAARLGSKRIVWLGADLAPLEPWVHGQLWNGVRAGGLDLEILEDARLPRRPPPPGLPETGRTLLAPSSPPNDTLVVRLRSYRIGSDRVVSSKEGTTACLTAELERSGDRRVRMLPLSADPGDVSLPADPGLPNLVYKYPMTDRGDGVFMLRARDREHALELAGAIDARTGERGGRFQAWVSPRLGAERFLSEYRAMVAVTPVGVQVLSCRRRQNVRSVPDTLPEGEVQDRAPFINTGFVSRTVGAPGHPDEPAIERAAHAFAERLAASLRRGFVWRDEAASD